MNENLKQDILDNREHSFYDEKKWEALSLAIIAITSAINIENIPDIETTLATHVLIFGFVKEIGKITDYHKHNIKEENEDNQVEYSKVELGTAVLRSVVAPFLTAVTVSNFEPINKTIHLTENLDDILLSLGVITGLLAGAAGVAGLGILIQKSGDGLSGIYKKSALYLEGKKDAFIANISELKPVNPIKGLRSPLQNPFQDVIFQKPLEKVHKVEGKTEETS